jgi:hypothetical protein
MLNTATRPTSKLAIEINRPMDDGLFLTDPL